MVSILARQAARAVPVEPSAGYTFPDAFSSRFPMIKVLAPIPLQASCSAGACDGWVSGSGSGSSRSISGSFRCSAEGRAWPTCTVILRRAWFWAMRSVRRGISCRSGFRTFQVRAWSTDAFREQIVPLLLERAWLGSAPCAELRPTAHGAVTLGRPNRVASARSELDSQSRGRALRSPERRFFPTELPHGYLHSQIHRARHHLIEGVMAAPARWHAAAHG